MNSLGYALNPTTSRSSLLLTAKAVISALAVTRWFSRTLLQTFFFRKSDDTKFLSGPYRNPVNHLIAEVTTELHHMSFYSSLLSPSFFT